MKRDYETPEFTVVKIQADDIVTASDCIDVNFEEWMNGGGLT